VASIAASIHKGWIDIGIGAGVESMTMYYEPANLMPNAADSMLACEKAKDCLLPMGLTSENVAERFNIPREKQDKFALQSHLKAAEAQSKGWFKAEIVPVKTSQGIVDADDGIRPNATIEALRGLKPAFKETGTTTPGNASQVSDGPAAVLMMKRSRAQQLGLPVWGRMLGFAVAGVPPGVMGIGPAVAIPKVLSQVGLSVDDISMFEINEAFASQAVYCVEKLGLPMEKVNPLGGAIALGHPLGCTGARQIATVLHHLARTKQKYGVVSMCVGTGMGAAAVFENEQ
jgi:acetyl-CoA acyltransferase 1